jgi:3'-5' exoribonuclease
VEGRLWDAADTAAAVLRAGSYVGVAGRISYFGGEPQLCVEEFEPLDVQLEDLPFFLPRSPRAQAAMEAELEQFIVSVREPSLRQLLHACLATDTEVGPGFRLAPAAKYNHHAYLGGLLEHTLSVAGICDRLAAHYGTVIDRDLLLTAALLHDIGKVHEIGASAGFPYTDEGKLLGHILLGLQLVTDAARGVTTIAPHCLLLLQHLIAAHQGRFEWQSPPPSRPSFCTTPTTSMPSCSRSAS